MNLQNFLESGLLESYILGQCSPDERAVVEQMLADHEIARKEKAAIESALEQYAQARAVEPPGWMRGRILDQINAAPPAPAPPAAGNSWRYLTWSLGIAAGIAALLYFNTSNRVQQLEAEKTAAQQQIQDCEQERAAIQQSINDQMAFIADTATRGIRLNWIDKTTPAPGALGIAYNNPNKATTYIRLTNLPKLAANQDYQFWVITKGNPVPQALDVIRYQDSVLIKTQYRDEAQAFAMSVEPKGGSPNGTPTKVVMLGS